MTSKIDLKTVQLERLFFAFNKRFCIHLGLDNPFLPVHNTCMEQDNRIYQVFVEYDGCINEKARLEGTREECIRYMQHRRAPKQCKWALVEKKSGRCVSFVL